LKTANKAKESIDGQTQLACGPEFELVNKFPAHDAMIYLQKPTTEPHTEADESSPHPTNSAPSH
jgi:hypothetical protein